MSESSFGGFGGLFKQAQQMQAKMADLQANLARRSVEAVVGGGLVKVTVNGKGEMQKIEIDPQAVDPRDVEMLQDLIVAATNQAVARAQQMAQAELESSLGPLAGLLGKLGG